MKRSYLGGFLVNPSPTYVTLVTIRFHDFSAMKHKSLIQLFTSTAGELTPPLPRSDDFENFIISNSSHLRQGDSPLALEEREGGSEGRKEREKEGGREGGWEEGKESEGWVGGREEGRGTKRGGRKEVKYMYT